MDQTLTKLSDFCQDRTAYHADAADVRPCHPKVLAQMQPNERHLCVQERRSELLAVDRQVVRQLQLLRRWRRPCIPQGFHAGLLPEGAMHAALLGAHDHGR